MSSTHFKEGFETASGYLDVLPDFGDPTLVKELLSETPFLSVAGIPWKMDGSKVTYAAGTSSFVLPNGDVTNFNDDNRRLRETFVAAGLVEKYQPAIHPADLYREIPRDWVYHPVNRR